MRDKNQLQFPYRNPPRKMPVEVNPMHMSLRKRRVAPIEITTRMVKRHVHPRFKRPSFA